MPTIKNIAALILAMVNLSMISSVRHLYKCFLGSFQNKSLNLYYHILEKVGSKLKMAAELAEQALKNVGQK